MKNILCSKEKLSAMLSFFLRISILGVVVLLLPINKIYGQEKTYNDLWDEEKEAYVINTGEDLLLIWYEMGEGETFDGKVILLNNDIDMSNLIDETTMVVLPAFEGYFNGQGYTISGWRTFDTVFQSFIADLYGTVTNVNFADMDLHYGNCIIEMNHGRIENCSFKGHMQDSYKFGFVDNAESQAVIKNCFLDVDSANCNSGILDNKGTIENCISVGTIETSDDDNSHMAFSNEGTVTNCYYINTNEYTEGGLGTSCTPEQLKDASTYEKFDFGNIWDIDEETNNGYPFLRPDISEEYLPTTPNMKEIPLTYEVSLEDVDYDQETGIFDRYFPVQVSEPEYTGTDEEIRKNLEQILSDSGIQVTAKKSSQIQEGDRKNIEVIPQEGYQVTIGAAAGNYVNINLGTAKEQGYLPKITVGWAEDGNTANFIGKADSTELSGEEKAEIIAQAKETMKTILDLNASKYPDEIAGNSWFAFNCARAGYYPEGITEEQLYADIVAAQWQQYVGKSQEELEQMDFDMSTVAKDVLAITALGYDATNVEGLNLIDILSRSNTNGNYFAAQYRLYAMYSGDYGTDYEGSAEGLVKELDFESFKDSYDTDDMHTMQVQPLFLTKNDATNEKRIECVKQWLSQSQTLLGTFPGYNGFTNPWTNAQVHILMGLLDIDWLSPDYVKNGNNVLATLIQNPEGSLGYAAERSQCVKGLAALIRSYEGSADLFDCSDVTGARHVNLEIEKLAENPGENDKESVYALWDVYNSLSDSKKEAVKDAQKLENVVNYFPQEEILQAKAAEFCARVDEFTVASLTLENRQAVESLIQELDYMDEAVKKYVSEDYVTKLRALSDRLYDLQAAENVSAKIREIGQVSLDSEKAVLAAREAYDALTEAQKQILADNGDYQILQEAEEKLNKLQQSVVQAVITNIRQLEEGVTLEDEDFLITVRDQYDALPDSLKEMVENYSLMVQAEAQMKSLKLSDVLAKIQGLRDIGELVSTDDEGNEVYTISEEDVAATAVAQSAWDDMVRKYQGIEEEVRTSEENAALLDKLIRIRELVKEYAGYVETYLEPLVSWLMGTTTVDDLNLAQVERRLTLYKEQRVSYGYYLDSVEGLSERAADLKAQAQALRQAKSEAEAIQQLIDSLPQESITSEEMLETAQEALANVDAAAGKLSQQAQEYLDWTSYNTLSANVELYLEKKKQAEQVSQMIADVQALAEENLTDDETVIALKAAQNTYDGLTADVQAMVVDAESMEALKVQISQAKTENFSANGIITVKETIPYDVVVTVISADSSTKEKLTELLKTDKKAELFTAFTLEAYQILADGSTQPWEVDLTAVLTADKSISGQNLYVLQMAEENAYIKCIADGSTLTFSMDSAGSYAIGMRAADDGGKADPVPGDTDNSGGNNNDNGTGSTPGGSGTTAGQNTGTAGKKPGSSSGSSKNTGTGSSQMNSVPKTGDTIPQEAAAGLLVSVAAAGLLLLLNRKKKMN